MKQREAFTFGGIFGGISVFRDLQNCCKIDSYDASSKSYTSI